MVESVESNNMIHVCSARTFTGRTSSLASGCNIASRLPLTNRRLFTLS